MPSFLATNRVDQLLDQLSQTREDQKRTLTALAEIEALIGNAELHSPLSRIATVLRRYRLDLTPAKRRQFDRQVEEARRAIGKEEPAHV